MKTQRHSRPELNAGSMADIAFLLLIFFLVTAVIPNDKGISRKLPKICPTEDNCKTDISKRNLLEIRINSGNELFINNKIIPFETLRTEIKNFINNNGDNSCEYCFGQQLAFASEHPKKAIIALQNNRETSYAFYIQIQDELSKAYFDLRSIYAKQRFNKPLKELTNQEFTIIKNAYPFNVSEVELD